MSTISKAKLYRALDIACNWLEQSGACTHYAGYLCDKDFTIKGVCSKCIRRHLLRLAGMPKKERAE